MCVSCFPTSPCEVFVFSSASHCLRLPPPSPPPSLPPPQPHLTQPHLTQLISHNSSPTTSLSRNLISHNLISSPLTQQPHTAHQHLVISHNLLLHNLHGKQAQHLVLLELLLRGRRSIWCSWTYFCVAGAALRLSGNGWRVLGRRWAPAAFVWLSHHLVLLELLLRGTRNIFLRLDFIVRGRCSSGKCWSALGRRWAPAAFAWRAYFCVAGATVLRCGNC